MGIILCNILSGLRFNDVSEFMFKIDHSTTSLLFLDGHVILLVNFVVAIDGHFETGVVWMILICFRPVISQEEVVF